MKGSAALRRSGGHSVVTRFERPPRELRLGLQAADPLVLHRSHGLLVDRWSFSLIDNALKHGRTPVAVSRAREGQVLTLGVCDLGDGLPEASSGVLLEAFARGDARRGVPGSGLGLSVVEPVVTRLGGILRFVRDDAGHHAGVVLP
jgi:two-component system osmolarity sensor histidine kinase EnvZ